MYSPKRRSSISNSDKEYNREPTANSLGSKEYATSEGQKANQPQWIRVPNSDDEYYWSAPSDGIRWFTNTSGMMWYEIDNKAWIIGSQVSEYRLHEGKIKSWNEWNTLAFGQTIAFKPNPEWLELPSGPGTKMSSSNSTWRTGHMDSEIRNAAKKSGGTFNTGHHKIAKSTIEWVYQNFSQAQLIEACEQLDLPKMASLNSFRSLFSNVTLGPDSGNRSEDLGQLTDLNTTVVDDKTIEQKGSGERPRLRRTLTPRSLEYFHLNNLIAEMGGPGSKTFDSRVKRSFSDEEFKKILFHLVQAEKKHAIMTQGGGLDTNVTMWSEDGSKKEKPWSRKVVKSEPMTFNEEDLNKTVRDLKSPQHQSINAKPIIIRPPYTYMRYRDKNEYLELLKEDDSESRRDRINRVTLFSNLHRMIMNKSTSKHKDSWHHGWKFWGNGKWTYEVNGEKWEINEGEEALPLNEAAEKVKKKNDLL